MSTRKNTHLDRPQLSLCVSLIENGVNAEALAVGCLVAETRYPADVLTQNAIKDLRRDADELQKGEIR
jgi:mitotic-spindle organizing protein 1